LSVGDDGLLEDVRFLARGARRDDGYPTWVLGLGLLGRFHFNNRKRMVRGIPTRKACCLLTLVLHLHLHLHARHGVHGHWKTIVRYPAILASKKGTDECTTLPKQSKISVTCSKCLNVLHVHSSITTMLSLPTE
jgi:hypothetical protein